MKKEGWLKLGTISYERPEPPSKIITILYIYCFTAGFLFLFLFQKRLFCKQPILTYRPKKLPFQVTKVKID